MGMLGMAVPPSQASSDNTGCVGKILPAQWCTLLDVYNDTRVNMMLLVGEPKFHIATFNDASGYYP